MSSNSEELWSSWTLWGRRKLSLQLLALERYFSETLSKEILTFITSSMSTISWNWNNHLLVHPIIITQCFLETNRHIHKVLCVSHFPFKHNWLHIEVTESSTKFLFVCSHCWKCSIKFSSFTLSTLCFLFCLNRSQEWERIRIFSFFLCWGCSFLPWSQSLI